MPKTKKKAFARREAPLEVVNFRADRAVLDAIERLTAATVGTGAIVGAGARSVAIRRALLDAAARLDGKGGEG